MIDLLYARQHPETVIALSEKKDPAFPIQRLLTLDSQRRTMNLQIEQLRNKKNELAKEAKSGVTDALRQESQQVSAQLKEVEQQFATLDAEFQELYLCCPNLLQEGIPAGGKEANQAVKTVGTKPTFSFTPKNHVELNNQLGWFDFEAASRMTAGGFVFYKKDAVRLIYALTQMMLANNNKHGYEPMIPPYLVNEESLTVASNFPKFKEQVYSIPADQLYLTPTAEVNLTNLYRDSILSAEQLPLRMTAWTSCFRREAGSYGAHERGLIRIHQFEKVELYSIVKPEDSNQELDRMVACAENLLQQLGLHYRISLLAAQDCSFASARTYDIEVWMPGQGAFYEVSSCSNCTDFQARRGQIRFKRGAHEKNELVHTLNASSLALPRLMVALMETYQQADGTVALPDVLRPFMLW
ncbi:serine--tRNA ligase [Candidatus Dependentiae bacterium]|nr:serine--tRNA ligase [Candidatus Dependentiae bacterium]